MLVKNKLLPIAALCLATCQANAELVYFSYTDTEGVLQERSLPEYINGESVSVGVSAGLDRKIRLSLYDESQALIYSETSGYITVNDRVSNPTGSDFYGKVFQLTKLESGKSYTIKQDVLDLEGDTVKSESSSFNIDTSAPTLTALNNVNSSGSVNPDSQSYNGEQILGRRSTSHLQVPYTYENSPLTEASWSIYKKSGNDWEFLKQVDGSIQDEGNGTGSVYLMNPGHIEGINGLTNILPNYSGRFKFELHASDSAGNKVSIASENNWVTCNYSEDVSFSSNLYKIVGITDSTSDGIEGIENTKGYRAFTPGDLITENPAGFILAIEKQYSRYGDPIFGLSTQYVGYNNIVQPLSVDDDYAYYAHSATTIQSGGSLIGKRVDSGGALCTGNLNLGTNFSDEALPPLITSVAFKLDGEYYNYLNGNTGTEFYKAIAEFQNSLPTGDYYRYYLGSQGPWSEFSGVKIEVEERNYDQTVYSNVVSSEKCVIPAGETLCEITYNRSLESLSTMWIHSSKGFVSTGTAGSGYRAIVLKVDVDSPIIESYNFDVTTSIIRGVINNIKDSDYYSNRKPANIFAKATNVLTGKTVDVFGTYTAIDDGLYFDYEIDLNSLSDGDYSVTLYTYDEAGNYGTLDLDENIVLDTSPPVLTLYNNDGVHNTDTTVEGLESLLVKLTDTSDAYITKIRLLNGPASDSLIMDWIDAEDYTYTLEYPRIFPSLEEGSEYTLAITASDIYQNEATYEFVFNYMPANIIELETGILLPTESVLLDSDDSPIYQIVTSKLRDNEGQLVTGELPVAFTVRADSEVSLIVNGKSVQPGETYEWNYDVSDSNGVLRLPITSDDKVGGKHGDFMFEVSGVTTSQ